MSTFVPFPSHPFRGAIPIALAFALMVPAASSAATLGLDLSGGTTFECATTPGCTAGFSFRVQSPVNVTGLAFWDEGPNGIVSDHPVALWNIGGALLASTTVTNASTVIASAETGGRWLVTAVNPITLSVGDYVLGAYYEAGSGDFLRGSATITTSPQLGFLDTRLSAQAGLTFPVDVFSQFNAGFFGPSLVLEPVSMPEPASVLSLGLGLVALLARRRRS